MQEVPPWVVPRTCLAHWQYVPGQHYASSKTDFQPCTYGTVHLGVCIQGALPWLFLCLCMSPSPDSRYLLGAAEDIVNARAHFHGLRVARPEEALCIAEDGLVIGSGSDCSAKLSSDKVGTGVLPSTWSACRVWAPLCAAVPCAFWQQLLLCLLHAGAKAVPRARC